MTRVFAAQQEALFGRPWPVWGAALLVAVANVFLFAFYRPFTASDGARNWGDWILTGIGVVKRKLRPSGGASSANARTPRWSGAAPASPSPTSSSFHSSSAIPAQSNPGPTFAVVAGARTRIVTGAPGGRRRPGP